MIPEQTSQNHYSFFARFLKKKNKQTSDYLKIKFQYDEDTKPIINQNPFIPSPIPDSKNAYRLNLSSFEIFLVNAYNIIPNKHNTTKIKKKTKIVQLSGILPCNVVYILSGIGTRNPPEKPIIEMKRIILLVRVCFFSICFNYLF